ncbi:MAG: BrnA antitoxin family protein [Gemmatimonadales bacterium]
MTKRLPTKPSRGRADYARMDRMTEEEIMRTSPPELADLPDDFFESAVIVMPQPKQPISLRVDEDILAWFKSNGPRYQSRMNAVLRAYMTAKRKPAVKRRKRKA